LTGSFQQLGRKTARLAFAAAVLVASHAAAMAQAPEKLRVGKAQPQAFSFTPVDVGVATGIFKKHGLEIEIVALPGGSRLIQAITAGGLDIGLGGGPELVMIAKGATAKGIAALANEPRLFTLMVGKKSGINTPEELKGRKISVANLGSATGWLVSELSRQSGWGSDGIHRVALGATTGMIAAMRTGQTDGIITDVGTAYTLQAAGEGKVLLRFGDRLKDFHLHVIFAADDLIAKRPDAARKFLAGWFETIAFMHANKAETVRIVQSVMNVTPEIADTVYDEVLPMFSLDGRFRPKALDVLARSFVEMGVVTEKPDMTPLYTEAFLPDSRAR
jgi:ABC-type nitrate/sulfonate/bicarbonate transport system substrate-binding protein